MTSKKQLSRSDFLKLSGTTPPPPHPPQVTIPGTELLSVTSSIVSQEYRIFVALPTSYTKSPDLKYPVLYVLDANALFGMTTETVRIFNLLNVIREIIVVGIGYPVDTFLATAGFRQRDTTPTEVAGWYDQNMKPGWADAPDDAGTGGAAHFLQFIREELMPLIDSTYRTSSGDNGILGHSATGLFALYALFTQPDTFRRYIIGSPAMWWDNYMILDTGKAWVANKTDVRARIFTSAGSLEDPDGSEMKKVVDLLNENQSPQLHHYTQIFDGEIHPSVVPAHISRGLRKVYEV